MLVMCNNMPKMFLKSIASKYCFNPKEISAIENPKISELLESQPPLVDGKKIKEFGDISPYLD
jgi:hypothetical protein